MIEAFNGAENPKAAVQDIWIELDGFYNYRAKTAEERVKPMMLKGKVEKDDVSGIIDMLADMKAIFHEARMDGMDTSGHIWTEVTLCDKFSWAKFHMHLKNSTRKNKKKGERHQASLLGRSL